MFGKNKHREPRPVVDPSAAMVPFEVINTDPMVWVQVPLDFPTPDDDGSTNWENRLGARFLEQDPAADKKNLRAVLGNAFLEATHEAAGHDGVWAAVRVGPKSRLLSVCFDVSESSPGSLRATEQRLLERADQAREHRSEGYAEQAAAPGVVSSVQLGGLGSARCIVRRDRYQRLLSESSLRSFNPDTVRRLRDPQFWDQHLSVYWLAAAGGKDLLVSLRSSFWPEFDLLSWAMPSVSRLVDGVTVSGRQPELAGAADGWAEAAVREAIEGARTDHRAMLERLAREPGL